MAGTRKTCAITIVWCKGDTIVMSSVACLLVFSLFCHSEALLIHVCSSDPENTNCSLDYYSQHIPQENNTFLFLDEGTHQIHLNKSITFDNLVNLSIIGRSRVDSNTSLLYTVTIKCIGRSGFVFSKINSLYISGFTMINCGGAFLNDDASISGALVMRETSNVVVENVVVKNSIYYGMFGSNMFGYSRIDRCLFSSNFSPNRNQPGGNVLLSWPPCDSTSKYSRVNDKVHFEIDDSTFLNGYGGANRAGGLYVDYHQFYKTSYIAISNSTFHGNKGGNINVVVHQVNQSDSSLFQLQLIKSCILDGTGTDEDAGAGGVSFSIKGNSTNISSYLSEYYVLVMDSVFTGNTNSYSSGGFHLNSHMMNLGKISMEFVNCSFTNNSGFEGGAIGLHLTSAVTMQNLSYGFLVLSSCTFESNTASLGGALFMKVRGDPIEHVVQTYISDQFPLFLMLRDCVLQGNIAFQSGSALVISTPLINQTSVKLIMNNTMFQRNKIIDSNQYTVSANSSHQSAHATIVIENSSVIIENGSFLNNFGSAIHVINSEVYLSKAIVFIGNFAVYGGGMKLSRVKLHLSVGTEVLFKNNHAYEYGSAVYIEENSLHEGCFVTSSHSGSYPGELPHITFLNNTAVHGKSAIYGPMDSCFENNSTTAMFIFQDEAQLSTSSSPASSVNVCVCFVNNTPNCDVNNLSVDLFSGSKFYFKTAVVDYNGEIIPSVISAELKLDDFNDTTVLTGGLQMTQRFCTDLYFTLSSYSTAETLTLTVVDYTVIHHLKYFINLLPCPVGFSVQEGSPECKCIPELTQVGAVCNIDDQTFKHNGNIWIGTYNDTDDLSNDTNTRLTTHALVSSTCPRGYCKPGHIRLMLEDADRQCIFNHSGILCGGCSPGLSISLGPPNCIECENTSGLHTALFVFLFSALGIVLIAFLRLCNLTISQGSANPVMFYANVIHVNGTFFFEQRHTNPLTVFVSWFNLDFGFESCFYNGMDATAKAWLQFVFPLYLWLVIGIIYFASQQSTKFVRLMGRHCHSVILTLLHLSFFKLCRATVAVLLYTDLQNENGEHFRVWRYNGNINYLSKKHAPLFAFATIMLILFIIPYLLIMICTPLIVRKGYQVRCIDFWKLKPFFDAYTGLYKDKAMFWNGLTTIIFTILLVTSTEVEAILNLVIIALTSLLLVFLNFAFGGIYRKWTLSIVEATIHTNLICLSILTLLYVTKGHSVSAAAYTSTAVSLIVFTGVMLIQGIKELCRVSKTTRRILSYVSMLCCSMSIKSGKRHRYHRRDIECSHGDKYPYTLDYYLLLEDSTGGYYDTVHRDHILTTGQHEETIEELPPVAVSTNPAGMQPLALDQNNLFPNKSNAITFSVVALEDAEEEEIGNDKKEEERAEEESVSYPANETNNSDDISLRGPIATSESTIPEVHIDIDIDENAPLLSPCIESPQSVLNYLTFEMQKATPTKKSPCQKVHVDQEPLFPLKKFRKASTYCPLDSDTDATGQRPSKASHAKKQHIDYLQRLTDPVELAVVDEGDSDQDMRVKTKIYQQSASSKNTQLLPKLTTEHSKRVRHYFESAISHRHESEEDEAIPLLSLKKDNHMWSAGIDLANPQTGIKHPLEDLSSQKTEFGRLQHQCSSFNNLSLTLGSHAQEAYPSPAKCFDDQSTTYTATQTIGSQFAESVPFIQPIEVIPVTSKGVIYSCEEYGVSVKIPEGALPPWLCSSLEVGIAPHGPFEFPAGVMPISPILWVCMQHESLLLKPVEIKLPHCLTDLSENDPVKEDIGFLKANHSSDFTINSNGRRVFQFRDADGKIDFPDPTSAVLTTKQFCFKCLKAKISPESAKKKGYCLIYGIPKRWPKSSAVNISIGITYFLQACIETFKRQINDPDVEYNFNSKQFHFKDPIQPIKVVIAKPIEEWIMIIQDGEEGITMEEVDFWNKDESLLETMEYNNAYPPRFILSVYKNGARTAAVARLQFEGTMKCEKINIILQHITHGTFQRKFNSEGASISTRSSMSSMQQMDVIASDLESAGEDEVLCREPDLADFMNQVANRIPMKWKQLGVQLRFDISDLEKIEAELFHEPSTDRCEAAFIKLFTRWKKVRPSAFVWATLIVALRTPALDEQVLAHEICTKLNYWSSMHDL